MHSIQHWHRVLAGNKKHMNVFFEFHKIVQHLQSEGVQYALIGGVAVAFHAEPRFTKDVDFLVCKVDLDRVEVALKKEGYFKASAPWTFKDSGLTLHRFLKVDEGDEMVVDILVAGSQRYEAIIEHALLAESKETGLIRVATKEDLIWMKQQRLSKQDEADIARLVEDNEENR
jgi:hypothetical protein